MTSQMRDRKVVVRDVRRNAADAIGTLAEAGTATAHEAIGRRGFLGPQIRPIQQGARTAGNAVTVLCHPGDNMMLHAAIEVGQEGDVLVVANTAPSTHGMFGELIATSLQARGVHALVMDAGLRDTAELREMGFLAWSQYVSCQGTVKATPGSVNVPVVIGGVTIHPGDAVCADDDGVVVVPHDELDWCLEKVAQRLAKEEDKRARLAAGELALDTDGLRDKLLALGVEFVDQLDDA
jgi:4-hydroxy-4-methyl-2-oxoglutarate aldolase